LVDPAPAWFLQESRIHLSSQVLVAANRAWRQAPDVLFERAAHNARASLTSRGTLRFHRDQLLDGVHFAVDEDDIGNLDRCPTHHCRFEVTGTETQHRSEEIRTK